MARFNMVAGARGNWLAKMAKPTEMTDDLVKLLIEEVRTALHAAHAPRDGRLWCPLCPKRHFRDLCKLQVHFGYHKKELIVGASARRGRQGSVIVHMHRADKMRKGVLAMTGVTAMPSSNYFKRSAELIRSHAGVANIPNWNGWEGVVVLDHNGPRLANSLTTEDLRISKTWYATREFLMLVCSFCDLRTHSKYSVVHDHIVAHFIAAGSSIPTMIPQFPPLWESIYHVAVGLLQRYKAHCLSTFTYRVVSLDSSYKYMLAVVGQPKHGKRQGPSNAEETHCAHVLMADRAVISCKAGFSEGVHELSTVIRESMSISRRAETEIFFVDTPTTWDKKRRRHLFENSKCVAGDPLHVPFNVEKYIRRSSPLAKDCRRIYYKFNKPPTCTHADMQYYDGETNQKVEPPAGILDAVLDKAYTRLQSEEYQARPYTSFKQYCIDIMAVKKHNPRACLKRARRDGTVGDILYRAKSMDKFGFFLNITIYQAKSGLECQFGSTPNEGIMKQLKNYNVNVFTSTQGRAKLTLELFCFAKIVAHFMKSQTEEPWTSNGFPTTVCELTFAILRKAISEGILSIPRIEPKSKYKMKKISKRPATQKRPASRKTIKRPSSQK